MRSIPALLLAAVLAAAPGPALAEGPRDFLLRLYKPYEHDPPSPLGPLARRIFAPALLALLKEDYDTTPPDDVGLMDGDPLCDCQDLGGLRIGEVEAHETAPGRASAVVRLRFPGENRTIRLDLTRTPAGWRIADIHAPDTPSLLGYLRTGLAQRRAEKAAARLP